MRAPDSPTFWRDYLAGHQPTRLPRWSSAGSRAQPDEVNSGIDPRRAGLDVGELRNPPPKTWVNSAIHLMADASERGWIQQSTSNLAGAGMTSAAGGADAADAAVVAAAAAALGEAPDLLVLTATIRVVGLLAAESDITIGYQASPAEAAVPLRVRLPDGSWRDLIGAVKSAEQAVAEHRSQPPITESPPDVLFCAPPLATNPEIELSNRENSNIGISETGVLAAPATGRRWASPADGNPSDGPTMGPEHQHGADDGPGEAGETGGTRESLVVRRAGPQISLRCLGDQFDADYLARFGGYLTTALAAMAANPDAAWADTDLLSPAERQHLLTGRSGPERPLPAEPAHVLIARQARDRPDAIAVLYRAERWTYDQINRAANRIAHALLGAGLRPEDVVAVGTERGPGWLCAILGVLKAGGCYLPVEPGYPAARAAELAQRANVRFALTEPAGLAGLKTRPDLWSRPVTDLIDPGAGYPDTDPAIDIAPGQLAYVYFTSGSTGAPKGAMCEHLGLINHLMAKVDDFGIGPGDVVVQNARQSFDISLWQLVAPLLVGGATLILPADDISDVRRLLDAVVAAAATVLQVVPSYLDVLLRYAEQHPRDLPALRVVCVTGEAITMPLVTRWFACCPGIALVNAYGATEASDDTTHEIMYAAPPGELVPVGRPIGNVTVYVLGPGDRLVPLGTPGEIAFSGICVGRGYINDPERTAEAFAADPFRPGHRIYRTGDYGRWLPTGSVEFHGRRDEQVKIQGVRIELGEVEARAVSHPRVIAASVVVVPLPGGAKSLAVFYTSGDELDAADLRAYLAGSLPPNALPSRIERIESLPLTANGKVDKRQLTGRALAARETARARDRDRVRPQTETQIRIARAWAQALNRPAEDIGSDDSFFDLGGSSLAALRVVASLDGLIALDDLVRNPVLSALAAVADGDHSQPGGLLRLLAGPATEPASALVCVPYAAGTAISFQALASAVAARANDIAVYAVQPPGHDLARRDVPLAELDELTKLLASEIAALAVPVALWGHCTGASAALETARLLDGSVTHVFVAARLLDPPDALAKEVAMVNATADADLGDELAAGGGLDGAAEFSRAEFSRADLAFVGRVYRHDTRTANQYLIQTPTGELPKLTCPVTVVASATDPLTAGYRDRFADWAAFADQVTLAELDDGGHYFPHTRPEATADIIVGVLR